MSTIPGVSATSAYGLSQSTSGPSATANPKTYAAQEATQASVITTLSGQGGASASLTYNAAGLLNAFSQANASQAKDSVSAKSDVQNALIAAQSLITQTLDSLSSSSSANAAGSDIASLLSQINSPASSKPNATVTSAQTAQNAVIDTQYAISQALSSLGSGQSR